MISWSEKKWIPQLKHIWKECFGDDEDYIDFYFANRFDVKNTLVYLSGEQPAAMASLFPAYCWGKGGKEKVRYIYAVATAKDFQGQGISTALLNYIRSYLKDQNEIGILVPATKELISFYDKRGFYPAICRKEKVIARKKPDLKAASIGKQEKGFYCRKMVPTSQSYKSIRDKHLGGEDYIEWSSDAVAFAIKDNAWQGGFTYLLFLNDEAHILMAYCDKKQLIVKESSLNNTEWQDYGMEIAEYFDCNCVEHKGLYTMSTKKDWLETAYFGLALDG